eukprot:4023762-Karenia_brevis.AAC.1
MLSCRTSLASIHPLHSETESGKNTSGAHTSNAPWTFKGALGLCRQGRQLTFILLPARRVE